MEKKSQFKQLKTPDITEFSESKPEIIKTIDLKPEPTPEDPFNLGDELYNISMFIHKGLELEPPSKEDFDEIINKRIENSKEYIKENIKYILETHYLYKEPPDSITFTVSGDNKSFTALVDDNISITFNEYINTIFASSRNSDVSFILSYLQKPYSINYIKLDFTIPEEPFVIKTEPKLIHLEDNPQIQLGNIKTHHIDDRVYPQIDSSIEEKSYDIKR